MIKKKKKKKEKERKRKKKKERARKRRRERSGRSGRGGIKRRGVRGNQAANSVIYHNMATLQRGKHTSYLPFIPRLLLTKLPLL